MEIQRVQDLERLSITESHWKFNAEFYVVLSCTLTYGIQYRRREFPDATA